MKYPKVLVFTPTYEGKEYCRKRFIENLNRISYPNWDFLLVDNSKSPNYARKLRREGLKVTRTPRGANSREALAASQNYARKFMLENDYDYLLLLESDLFPPADIIWRLLKHAKRVVGAYYLIGQTSQEEVGWPCVFVTEKASPDAVHPARTRLINSEEWAEMKMLGGLHEVHGMGVGCTLVTRQIIEDYPWWTDNRFDNKHSDVYFYMKLWNDKIPVYVDFDTQVEHQPSKWDDVIDR